MTDYMKPAAGQSAAEAGEAKAGRGALRVLALLALVAAVGGAGYWVGSSVAGPVHGSAAQVGKEAGSGAVAAATNTGAPASGERQILYYRNPMGLPDTSPVPKKDSMGMDYIPVYADEANDDAGTVRVSPARMQTLGVRTATVARGTLDAVLRAKIGRASCRERV